MWCIYTMEYYSVIKKNEIWLFAATWVDFEGTLLGEISQRKTNTVWYYLNAEYKKHNNLVNRAKKKKQAHRYREQASSYLWGKGGGRGSIGIGD